MNKLQIDHVWKRIKENIVLLGREWIGDGKRGEWIEARTVDCRDLRVARARFVRQARRDDRNDLF